YDQFVADFAEHKLAADARFNKALAYKRLGLDLEAREAYQDVVENYPQTDMAFKAQMHIGYMLQDGRKEAQAAGVYRQIVNA
ncbi:tetratricopeptide repeat protein, partial [Klebsiella pneumoniae]|uniref:tetratricopeptide repeat protein n=1 Tax=Klebsiella pneumoniae TaxID=573 RepID=UPI002730D4A6